MRIAFLVGNNKYHSTSHFARSLAKALGFKNVVRVFRFNSGNERDLLSKVASFAPQITCSFSDITFDGEPFGQVTKVPHLSFFLDPAIYFLHQLTTPYSLVSCVDKEDVSFIHALGFKDAFHLPHAVESQCNLSEEKKIYDVVFLGSPIDYLHLEKDWKQKYSKKVVDTLHRASERVLSKGNVSILNALVSEGVNELDLPGYHDEVDTYTRGKDRVNLLLSLQGLEVSIWGDKRGWETILKGKRGFNLYPTINFNQAVKVMNQAKVVLNSSPRFKNGGHERILHGVLAGAMVLTGDNPYIRENFPSLLTYNFGSYVDVKDKILSFLEKPDKSAINEMQKKIFEHHTWEKRADLIMLNINKKIEKIL